MSVAPRPVKSARAQAGRAAAPAGGAWKRGRGCLSFHAACFHACRSVTKMHRERRLLPGLHAGSATRFQGCEGLKINTRRSRNIPHLEMVCKRPPDGVVSSDFAPGAMAIVSQRRSSLANRYISFKTFDIFGTDCTYAIVTPSQARARRYRAPGGDETDRRQRCPRASNCLQHSAWWPASRPAPSRKKKSSSSILSRSASSRSTPVSTSKIIAGRAFGSVPDHARRAAQSAAPTRPATALKQAHRVRTRLQSATRPDRRTAC